MPLSGTKRRAEGRVKCEMDGEWGGGGAEGGLRQSAVYIKKNTRIRCSVTEKMEWIF